MCGDIFQSRFVRTAAPVEKGPSSRQGLHGWSYWRDESFVALLHERAVFSEGEQGNQPDDKHHKSGCTSDTNAL
jgi:hypothetical protein